ncbi:MAG: VWA domain-containing protein [Actinomycetota bacterium]|nr:VWA domain-containing protein [Actinomycetota bacterium]
MIEPAHPLVDRVTALVDQLRRRGIDVTTGAVIDAFTALTHLPLVEPESVKAGLRATLVKNSDPTGEFDRAFRSVFAGSGTWSTETTSTHDTPATATPGQLSNALLQAMQQGDEAQIAWLAQRAVEALAGFDDDAEHSERYYLQRVLRAIDLSRMLSAAMQQLRRDGELTELELMLARNEFAEMLDQFRRRLAAEIAARMTGTRDNQAGADIDTALADRDMLQLSALELSELRRVVQPLARQLAARISSHRRLRSTGRLDPRRTVRRSLQAGGVPLDVVMRRRHPHRPELVLLCDVSGSVAEFAQFTFTLVHALHEELRRVRSFAFVDGIAEVTDLFETARHEIHVNRFVERRGVLGDDGHSDYGRALTRFVEQHLDDAVSSRSTVIICGDARTNYRPDGADALRTIAAHARRVFWLNPEPEDEWGTTDSAMDDYRALCRGAFEVRSLRQLGDVIASLV